MNPIDIKINHLEPGARIVLSVSNGIVCYVEKSGNGKELRYVRTFPGGSWSVFHRVTLSI